MSRNIINYSIVELTYETIVETLKNQFQKSQDLGSTIVRLVLFGACKDNSQYADRVKEMTKIAEEIWGDKTPIVSYVTQPTLEAELVLETHSCTLDQGEEAIFKSYAVGGRSISIQKPFGRLLFVGGLQGDVVTQSIEDQANLVFDMANEIIKQEGVIANQIVRQWNYVEQITALENGNQHYQLLNNARSNFYDQCSWENGFPAATGIGSDLGGILVDIDIVVPASEELCVVTPIDNKLQVAAHAYSEDVLIDANRIKATPKFERAKKVEGEGVNSYTYISGTAAIRGEESLTGCPGDAQTLNTLENIAELVDDTKNITLFRIYVKEREDFAEIKRVVSEHYPNIDTIYTIADVCREELLVEIEGISISQAN